MNWLKNFLSKKQKSTETPRVDDPSVVIYKKTTEGTFDETQGDRSTLAVLVPQAAHFYKSIMAASAKNSLRAKDESDIGSCLGLLNKILEIQTDRGDPYGMRADIYLIRAQLDRDRSLLERAEQDYKKGLEIGSLDTANHALYEKGLENIKILKKLF